MKRILVIDDNKATLETLEAMLERKGFEVRTAKCGNEGLNELNRSQFDLIVTDIVMPDGEGLELIYQIRQQRLQIPIIAMSGGGRLNPSDSFAMAKALGVAATLQKPFGASELLNVISQSLEAE